MIPPDERRFTLTLDHSQIQTEVRQLHLMPPARRVEIERTPDGLIHLHFYECQPTFIEWNVFTPQNPGF